MKVVNNGRKSLLELNEMFDKVIIRYFPGTSIDEKTGEERETMKTMVALVDGTKVHIGVAKWSNRGFRYCKTRGRAMAMGRAEIAFNHFHNKESTRDAYTAGIDPLSYTTVVEEPTVKNIIKSFFAVEELNNDLV